MTTYFPGILSNGALVAGLAAGTVRTTLGLGTAAVASISAFGATLIDDAAAVDARNTLGLGTANDVAFAGGTFTGNLQGAELLAVGVSSTTRIFQSGGVGVLANQSVNIAQWNTTEFNSYGRIGLRINTAAVYLDTDAAHALAQRNGVNAQSYHLYKTYTSATSNERLAFDTTAAGFLDIVAARGSLGGAENGIRIGGKLDGGSFVPWATFTTNGDIRITGGKKLEFDTNNYYQPWDGSTGSVFAASDAPNRKFWFKANGSLSLMVIEVDKGRVGIGTTTPTAVLHTKAGTATAGTAPIKLTTGVLMTTPEAGAIEYDGTNLYFTDSGGTRRTLAVV